MNYYLDIKIVADEEVPVYFIRNKIYAKLHKALNTLKSSNIGVSFPNYRVKLGDVVRLHSSQERLVALQALNWLGGLSGYCVVSDILAVPELIEGYRVVSRIRTTMNLKKLEERITYQKAQGELKTDEDVKNYERQYKQKMFGSSLDNPYLELQSSSTTQVYRRFIQFGDLSSTITLGKFDEFGLSKSASIPWF